MAIYALDDLVPEIDPSAYVHPDATVIGAVTIGAESTIWPGAVLRGDYGPITIGARTSIQDNAVVHVPFGGPTVIGSDCVVGHLAYLEGCVIADHVLIGAGSSVLESVVVGEGALVGAGAVVSPRTEVPAGALALGVPAKIRPGAAPGDYRESVDAYRRNAARYRQGLRRMG